MDNNEFELKAKQLGINLNKEMLKQFEEYFDFLIEYNQKVNLTAITQKTEVYLKHFLDSIAAANFIKPNALVVDVGAGAGFPGIPIKIVRPDISLVLVDSLNKRVVFLRELIDKLKLENAKAVHSRAEDFALKNRQAFDVALARAVAKLNTLSEYCLPLVKVGGSFLAYKTPDAKLEIEHSQKALNILGAKLESVIDIVLPDTDIKRSFAIIQKTKNTPLIYPRGKNQPKINPL